MTDKRDDNSDKMIVRQDVSAAAKVRSCSISCSAALLSQNNIFDRTQPRRLLQAIFLGVTIVLAPGTGLTAPLSAPRFVELAQRCAPSVSLTVLRGIARTESRFEPLALRDNTRGLTRTPQSLAAAVDEAQRWLAAGDSVDLGLMQINAANLPSLGLTLATALDPCWSLSAAAAILRSAYARGASVADSQAALLIALSRYNTGRPLAGLFNGYVGKVLAAAPGGAGSTEPNARRAQTAPNSLPAWDVWTAAAYARAHGAPWLVAVSRHPEPQMAVDTGLPTNPAQIYPTSDSRDDRRSP